MAGRIAEEIISGDISTARPWTFSRPRIWRARWFASTGMSDKLGMVQYGSDDEYVFLGREMARTKVYSESTAQEIDEEIKRIIDEALQTGAGHYFDQSRQARIDRQRAARVRNARSGAGRGNRQDRQIYAAAAQASKWSADGRPGRHAAAGNPAQTSAAQAARTRNARARAGLILTAAAVCDRRMSVLASKRKAALIERRYVFCGSSIQSF